MGVISRAQRILGLTGMEGSGRGGWGKGGSVGGDFRGDVFQESDRPATQHMRYLVVRGRGGAGGLKRRDGRVRAPLSKPQSGDTSM